MTIDLDQFENIAARARSPITVEGSDEPLVYLPEGVVLQSLEPFLEQPVRIKRRLAVTTSEAFIAYFNKFKDESSAVYADLAKVTISGIIDDHLSTPVPQWGSHRVAYQCPYSREWQAWIGKDRHQMTQIDFAEWLEDRIADVTEPDGNELLDLATQLHIIRKATFGSATTLKSGETAFQYAEENQTGTVEIPATITIGIPVFVSGTHYAVKARFKYRLSEGVLALWFELIEPQKYIDDAFAEVLEAVNLDTERKPTMVEIGSLG